MIKQYRLGPIFLGLLILLYNFTYCEDKVENIIFLGNETFSKKAFNRLISSKIKKPIDEFDIEQDRLILKNFYEDEGFLLVEIEKKIESGKIGKIIHFLINEGPRVKINAISLTGFSAFPELKIMNLLRIRIGDYLINQKLEDAINRVADFYKNSGYPYFIIEYEVSVTDNYASIYFAVEEGPLSYIKEVKIRGNNSVNSWTIIRASEIKNGERFSQKKLYEAQRRLYATRLFDRVSFYVMGIEEKQESLTVRFDVRELKARGFTFGFGYQLPPNRFLFGLGWEHLNILNRGQNLNINSEFTPNFQGDYELNLEVIYKVPYLIKMPLNFTTKPFFILDQEQTNRITEFGVETGVNRYLGTNWGINVLNRFRRLLFSYSDSLVLDTMLKRGITNSIILNITYDSRNNFFNPSQGVYLSPLIEVAGGLLMGNNDFYRTNFEFRIFQGFRGWFIFAFRAFMGANFPYGQTEKIPYYEQYSIGGRNTLRGYDEKSVGPDSVVNEYYGDYILNTNLEIRTGFYKNFGLALFFDAGDVENNFNDFKLSTYQYSIGFGIRYNTPVGPIRLDYGKRLKDPEPNDRGKLYIGLLHAF